MKNLQEQIKKAVTLYQNGKLSKAIITINELIDKNPNIAFLFNLKGLICASQNKYEESLSSYKQAIKIDPNFALAYNNIGLLIYNKNEKNYKDAESYYKKSITINNQIVEPYNNLGTLYNSMNKHDEAIKFYNKAISLNQSAFFSHFNLGSTLITIGEFDKAKFHLKRSIELNPQFAESHRLLSRIKKYSIKDPHLLQLNEIYKIAKDENKISLCFALGKAYEDIKDYKKSFFFYKEGNTLHRKKINYSTKDEKRKFSQIKKFFKDDTFKKFSKSGNDDDSPIFILGMPRSGTTLIEQILSSHPNIYGADEINFIPELVKDNFNFSDEKLSINEVNIDKIKFVGDRYIEEIKRISKNSSKISDKLPVNFLYIGFIKICLPNSKIIHCYRDPMDNIFSIYKNYFTSNKIKYAYELNEIFEYYNLYKDLINYWNKILPNFIINIKYENLISNPNTEIKNLIKSCNLEWSEKCLSFYNNNRPIKTASNTQARSKIYKSSVNSWKNYKLQLNKYVNKIKS